MFTGIVIDTFPVTAIEPGQGSTRIQLDLGDVAAGIAIGDSVAINGACLTALSVTGARAAFEAVPETLALTTLGTLRVGERVNIELAMRPTDHFGGHFVQGHIDGVGKIESIQPQGDQHLLRIGLDSKLAAQVVPKGSITLDGVSLTVIDTGPQGLSVALIPHTRERTTFGMREAGDRINVEIDILSKTLLHYLARIHAGDPGMIAALQTGGAGLSKETLARAGFIKTT